MPHSKPIIESIRDYLLTCDFLKDGKVNIDYLPDEMAYSIDPIGGDPIYRRYVDGDALRQFQFAITSKEAYDGDARTGIENSEFYQFLQEWIVDVQMSGYLFSMDSELGKYQIQCRLIYK